MKLLKGDCLELMKDMRDGSIDMILADYLIASAKFKLALGMEVKELNE